MGESRSTAREILGMNIRARLAGELVTPAAQRISKASSGTVSKNTFIKMASDGGGNLDSIEALANFWGVSVGELLTPNGFTPSIASALETIAGAIQKLPRARRKEIADRLHELATLPDSPIGVVEAVAAITGDGDDHANDPTDSTPPAQRPGKVKLVEKANKRKLG